MLKHVKSIAIVGGGSSGWMSASYLGKILSDVDVTVIESPKIPVIGVGEATVPSLTRFVNRLGFMNTKSWLGRCEGTLKTGILFENWYEKGDHYWHPFEALDYLDDQVHTGHYWVNRHRSGIAEYAQRKSFSEFFHVTYSLNCLEKRGPVVDTYAYHINADLFGEMLRQYSPKVRHILDDVVSVKLNDREEIEELVTAEHGCIKADLYIDCTGFKRRLIREVDPHQKFHSNIASLFCDRAVVLRFPYGGDPAAEMDPYVTARAMSNGWMWKIPLHNRISSGYVYSSAFLSETEAEEELRSHWGHERTKDAVAHKVKFETGKLKNLWVRNCVAIGLAGGFVEPLESTGLAITQVGLEVLASVLDARCYDDHMISRYNMHLDKFCTDIVHFIISHYCFTSRDDTAFWRAVKNDTHIPEDLAARLDAFRRLLPTFSTKGLEELWAFRDFSWFAVLLGMNFPFDLPAVGNIDLERAKLLQEKKRRYMHEIGQKVGNHYEYLRKHVYENFEVPIDYRIKLNAGR